MPTISTGQMFRDAYNDGTEFGIEAMKFIRNGNLVSDDLTNEIVRKRLLQADAHTDFILDGYPRTVNQAIVLDEMLDEMNTKLDAVVNILVSHDVLFERLEQREDDTHESVQRRLEIYETKTKPLLDYYEKR